MRFLLTFLILLIAAPSFTQWSWSVYYDSLQVKQRFFQSRNSKDEDWQNVYKDIMTYNAKGYPVVVQDWRTNGKGSIYLSWEETYGNDARNNVVLFIEKSWNDETWELQSENRREMEYDGQNRLLEIKYYREEYYSDSWYESITSFVYDEFGRRIIEQDLWSDNENPENGFRRKNYWKPNGCQSATSSFDLQSGQWILRDSLAYMTDSNCNSGIV